MSTTVSYTHLDVYKRQSNTPGKCSPDGRLREYSYTREIAGRVVFELRKLGIDAELVVKEEIDRCV